MQKTYFKTIIFIILFFLILSPNFSIGATISNSKIEELKAEIKKQNEKIIKLQKELKKYQQNIENTKKERNSLQYKIRALDANVYQLNLKIKTLESKIELTNASIEILNEEINQKENQINSLKKKMSYILNLIYENQNPNFLYIFLNSKNISDFLNKNQYLKNLEYQMNISLMQLKEIKKSQKEALDAQKKEKEKLLDLKNQLTDQKLILNGQKKEKEKLLLQTKRKESLYKKILAKLQKERKSIEKEIGELEAKLKQAIQKESLPKGKGFLKWPLKHITITQGYGMTKYAKSGAYGGSIHNGLDLRGVVGTRVYAAANGVVLATGDNKRYAYGKWIAIKHKNGLITLYAHLSLQKVKKGDLIKQGDVIGYVGATGYVTGPHLHFTVYAPNSFGLRQSSIISWLKIPYGAPLNPLDYL